MSLKLTLSKRAGQIGPSVNTRTERHGEEAVPGIDIPVSGIFLDADELAIVLQDTEAHRSFFTKTRSSAPEPRFQYLAPQKIEGKLEGAKVLIQVGDHQLLLKPAKVKSIELAFQVGGMTEMRCTIQGNPSSDTDVLELLNAKCRISITGAVREEKVEDPELPLDHQGQGFTEAEARDAAGEADASLSRIGRQVQVSSIRQARRAAKKRTRADIDG